MSAATVACARCGEERPALERPPFGGSLGGEIRARVCAGCWAEWRRVEIMVINELRLNFMEPSSQEILAAEMRRFLGLDGSPGAEPEKNPDPQVSLLDAEPQVVTVRSLRGPAMRFALLVVLLAGTFAIARWTPVGEYLRIERLQSVRDALRGAWWSPIAHLAVFVLLGGVGVPATPIILAGAAIFGAVWGTLWNWVGIVLASVAGYLLAKALGREFVERIGGERIRRAEKVLDRRGFLPLVAVRFIPVPFALVNAAAAVVGVRFGKFLLATMLGMVFPIGIFTYFAAVLLEAATGDRAAIARRLLIVSLTVACLVFLPIGIRHQLRRRRLRELRGGRAGRRENGVNGAE